MKLRKLLVQFVEVALKLGIFVEFPFYYSSQFKVIFQCRETGCGVCKLSVPSYKGTPWKLGDLVKLPISVNLGP